MLGIIVGIGKWEFDESMKNILVKYLITRDW